MGGMASAEAQDYMGVFAFNLKDNLNNENCTFSVQYHAINNNISCAVNHHC